MDNSKVSLSAAEAVSYARSFNARKVLPIHFEGWVHFPEDRDEATEIFNGSEIADRLVLLHNGETTVIE